MKGLVIIYILIPTPYQALLISKAMIKCYIILNTSLWKLKSLQWNHTWNDAINRFYKCMEMQIKMSANAFSLKFNSFKGKEDYIGIISF